jgi:hypothetical protein
MNTFSRFIAAAALAAPLLVSAAAPARGYDIDIVSPADLSTVFDNSGDFLVRMTVVPDLAAGDRLEFLVDGNAMGPPSAILEIPLQGIPRGEHVLQARIIDATGNVGSISPPSVVYVWQASMLFPNRQAGRH